MKLIQVEENGPICLIPLGDSHVGSNDFNEEKFKETIEWIKTKKNVRVVLMGDLIDAGLKDSVGGGTFDNYIDPEQQIEYVMKSLMPIKDKIWCLISGNHEDRVRQRTGIDICKSMAKSLDVPYGNSTCFIKAKIGKINYIIYASHGNACSLTPAGKLNAITRLGTFTVADLILMGHVHELMNHTTDYFRVDIGNKMIVQDKKHYVITGHFLKYGGYAQQKNMFPGKSGVAKILLNPERKDIHVSL